MYSKSSALKVGFTLLVGVAVAVVVGGCAVLDQVKNDSAPPTPLSEMGSPQGKDNRHLLINPPYLDFGIVSIDSQAERRLAIKNNRSSTLTVTLSVDRPFDIASSPTLVLSPGQSDEVVVRFRPNMLGVFQEDVSIDTGKKVVKILTMGRACTDSTCSSEITEISGSQLEDLIAIIKSSQEYFQLRDRFLSEAPESARNSCQSKDLKLATVTFTLKKEITDPNQFVVYPLVFFTVDYVSRKVIEVVISQVDEETLEQANLTFLKRPENSKKIKLDPAITEKLKEAKRTRRVVTKPSAYIPLAQGRYKCTCTGRSTPYTDWYCWWVCYTGCAYACYKFMHLPGLAECLANCMTVCDIPCTAPSICNDWHCEWSEYTPMSMPSK